MSGSLLQCHKLLVFQNRAATSFCSKRCAWNMTWTYFEKLYNRFWCYSKETWAWQVWHETRKGDSLTQHWAYEIRIGKCRWWTKTSVKNFVHYLPFQTRQSNIRRPWQNYHSSAKHKHHQWLSKEGMVLRTIWLGLHSMQKWQDKFFVCVWGGYFLRKIFLETGQNFGCSASLHSLRRQFVESIVFPWLQTIQVVSFFHTDHYFFHQSSLFLWILKGHQTILALLPYLHLFGSSHHGPENGATERRQFRSPDVHGKRTEKSWTTNTIIQ